MPFVTFVIGIFFFNLLTCQNNYVAFMFFSVQRWYSAYHKLDIRGLHERQCFGTIASRSVTCRS